MLYARLALVLLALAAALPRAAQAAGRKTGGIYAVEDDLLGGSAGGTLTGGGRTVFGALGQTATLKHKIGPLDHHAGFFRFPFPYTRLQILVPGEMPEPDVAAGKTGVAEAVVAGSTFTVRVRSVDLLNDQAENADTVRLFSTPGVIGDLPLTSGATSFSNVVFSATGTYTLSALDLSNFTIPTATAALVVVPASPGPPGATLAIAGSTVATLGGRLAGQAADFASVRRVIVELRNIQSGLYLAGWTGVEGFTSAVPVIGTATLSAPFASRTEWILSLPDSALSSGVSYEARLRVSNPTGFENVVSATFTFNAALGAFAPDDGQGSAVVTPAISSGCEPVDATLVYTVGASGLKPGGALAVRVPEGWSAPQAADVSGFNSAAVSTTLALAPTSFSSATLGAGWMLVTVPSGPGLSSGATMTLRVRGRPPLDARGRGTQTFEVRHQAATGGALKPIAAFPSLSLFGGSTTYLSFEDESPIALGPAQFSPVMRVRARDLCGTDKSTTTVSTVWLSVGAPGVAGVTPDAGATFFSAATAQPVTSVSIPGGLSLSTSFYYLTTNPGALPYEVIRASITNPNGAEAVRLATLANTALSVASISVDTGTLSPSATSAALTPGGAPAFLRFKASAAGVPWDVVVSTDGTAFSPAVLRASGETTATGESLAWTGVDALSQPPRAAAAGAYKIRLRLGGGTVADATREFRVVRSAFVTGQLAAAGARALISARGPSLGAARSTLASATGYFELRGLAAGSSYALSISTVSGSSAGRSVTLSTSIFGVVATDAGTAIPGPIALPAAALLRVSAQSSRPAPREAFGAALVRDASGELAISGSLRFSSGSASSDDGATAYGVSASTWTQLPLAAGTYTVDVAFAELGLSTRATVALVSGATTDLPVVFARKASLFGTVVVATAPAAGAQVSLEATRAGGAAPERYASVSVANHLSTASFALHGLDAGAWTVVARAAGLLPAATSFTVLEDADVGVATAPAAALALPLGGVVVGTVSVSGQQSGADVSIEATRLSTLETRSTVVRVPAGVASATASFAVGGLTSGSWVLRATGSGLSLSPSTGVVVVVSTPAATGAVLPLTVGAGRLSLSLVLPPKAGCRAPAEFAGAFVECGSVPYSDVASLAGSTRTLHCSSMTVVLPAQAPGVYTARAAFEPSATWASAPYSLVAGSTTFGALSLAGSTFPVSGKLALSGFTVGVSSVAGILNRGLSLNVELVPLEPGAGDSLTRTSTVAFDGSFAFQAASGRWRLRVPGDLDLDPSNGIELAEASRVLVVTAPVSGLVVTLVPGARATGVLALPPGASGGGSALVTLEADDWSASGRAVFAPGASKAAYALYGAGAGRALLSVRDAGSPARFGAVSRVVVLPGGAADLGTDELAAAGALAGRLAVERRLADGTTTQELLPGTGASVSAAASPWRAGGLFTATVDADGRFRVADLPPGAYDLELSAPGLVPALLPGLRVAEGQTSDVGAVVLRAGRSISGRALDAVTGLPAANVRVRAAASLEAAGAPRARTEEPETRTDSAGRYSLSGLDSAVSRFDVTAGEAGYQSGVVRGVDAAAAGSVDFSLRPARFAITGRVAGPSASRFLLDEVEAAQAGADGLFSIPVATGAYRLSLLAQGYATLRVGVNVTTASVSLGILRPSAAASLSGAARDASGGPVSPEHAASVFATTADLTEVVPGELVEDAAGSVVGYAVAGLTPGRSYRLAFVSATGGVSTPAEAASVVTASTSEARALDVVVRPPRPSASARVRRSGASYALTVDLSRPLRSRKPADELLSALISTVGATGSLSARSLSADRRRLTAVYTPGVTESSFTFRVAGYSADVDPDSADPLDPELPVSATFTFLVGADGAARAPILNLAGGVVALDGELGRVTLPRGAFAADASTVVAVALHVRPASAGLGGTPVSAAYEVTLPAGARSTLQRPADLTVAYSTAADPSKLSLYWYNPAAGAWILQQDAAGGAPVVDLAKRTYTLKVGHFSTFALFESGAAIIGGADFSGGDLEAFNFPNPFDLRTKVVTKLHPGALAANETIRGTMIRLALPRGLSGRGKVRIFSVSGEKVRTLDLGDLAGGNFYYAEWDGRNDAGLDVASGVYIGEVRVGRSGKFIRMALLK